jgi:hypothetical protein
MDEVSDATLRKNTEATVFPKMDEGTDVTLQKISEAMMPLIRGQPRKNFKILELGKNEVCEKISKLGAAGVRAGDCHEKI